MATTDKPEYFTQSGRLRMAAAHQAGTIMLTMRFVHTVTKPLLLRMIQSGRLDAKTLPSHRFELSEIMTACDIFAKAANEGALTVSLENASASGGALTECR